MGRDFCIDSILQGANPYESTGRRGAETEAFWVISLGLHQGAFNCSYFVLLGLFTGVTFGNPGETCDIAM